MLSTLLSTLASLPYLKAKGKEIFLVSGGFRQIIHPLADKLGIPLTHVFANTILFDVSAALARPPLRHPRHHPLSALQAQGRYAGFDENEFTCRSGGKPAAIRHIKASSCLSLCAP